MATFYELTRLLRKCFSEKGKRKKTGKEDTPERVPSSGTREN
jgi:hypothetical protein